MRTSSNFINILVFIMNLEQITHQLISLDSGHAFCCLLGFQLYNILYKINKTLLYLLMDIMLTLNYVSIDPMNLLHMLCVSIFYSDCVPQESRYFQMKSGHV